MKRFMLNTFLLTLAVALWGCGGSDNDDTLPAHRAGQRWHLHRQCHYHWQRVGRLCRQRLYQVRYEEFGCPVGHTDGFGSC